VVEIGRMRIWKNKEITQKTRLKNIAIIDVNSKKLNWNRELKDIDKLKGI